MCALNLWSAASMPPSPYVTHVPVMTGGYGYDDVRQFYATWFIGRWPADVQIMPISRTVGQDRVIDELIVSFTYDAIARYCHTKARGISSPGIDKGPPHGASQSWRAAMEHYVGLDVSLKLTAICIVDQTGRIEREGVVASNPEAIAAFIKSHAPHVTRIGLETGATSPWLWTELNKLGLAVMCIDARHAKAALKMQINKSDRNDAVGIARIMQCGWYKEVRVKDLDSHAIKALLVSRALLVKIKRDLENQIRGLLKNLGLVIGRA